MVIVKDVRVAVRESVKAYVNTVVVLDVPEDVTVSVKADVGIAVQVLLPRSIHRVKNRARQHVRDALAVLLVVLKVIRQIRVPLLSTHMVLAATKQLINIIWIGHDDMNRRYHTDG